MYRYHDQLCKIEINVKAKNALSAAKKIWRQLKTLTIFTITNGDTGDVFTFDSSLWSRHGKFLQ